MLAHQNAVKQNANAYTTSLSGLKFKIAHKRAGSEKWSATPKTQRKRMIAFLQTVIADLEKQNDSEGDVIPTRQEPPAREQRKARTRRGGQRKWRTADRTRAPRSARDNDATEAAI